MHLNLGADAQGRAERSVPVRFREEIQEVLRRGDGELVSRKMGDHSTIKYPDRLELHQSRPE